MILALGALLASAFGLAASRGTPIAAGTVRQAHPADAQQCPDPYLATRDPANPLALPTPPGADPLNGAAFFVDGPRHGEAAGAAAELLGLNPTRYHDDYAWARFKGSPLEPRLHRKLTHNRGLARKVALLEKIGNEPEPSASASTPRAADVGRSSPRCRRSSATT